MELWRYDLSYETLAREVFNNRMKEFPGSYSGEDDACTTFGRSSVYR